MKHVDESRRILDAMMAMGVRRPLLAFSGGKDSIVTALLMIQHGIEFECVNEEAFTFASMRAEVRTMARELGLCLTIRESLPPDFVKRHPEILFSSDSKIRGWTFAIRQQKTVKRFAAELAHDVSVFGRRTQENFVPAPLYRTNAGLQCHPIRAWTTKQVWEFIDAHYRRPWVYSTRFGRHGPFYSFPANEVNGDIAECWRIVQECDPTFVPARFGLA